MITRRVATSGLLAVSCFGSPAFGLFNSNGADQRTVDLSLRPQPARGNDATTLAGRTQVDPGTLNTARTVIIIFDGQSTNNNSVNATASPANPTKIFNLSIGHRGACFIAKEPLLSSDLAVGHNGMYLADKIITDGVCDQVVLINEAIGGSYMADHSPTGGSNTAIGTITVGELAYRVGLTARCIANAGLSGLRTIIDYQQGEWDSDSGTTTQAQYASPLNSYIAECKKVGLLRTGNVMFVNLCTRIAETAGNRNPIRAAQAAVVDGGLVRSGADSDSVTGGTNRQVDGQHFTGAGSVALAALKAVGIENYITNG